MKVQQKKWIKGAWKVLKSNIVNESDVQLVFAFASKSSIEEFNFYEILKSDYPNADIAICSTSGEIIEDQVNDDSISVTAIQFDKTRLKFYYEEILEDNVALGGGIAKSLSEDDLKHIFILSEGLHINGTKFIEGVNEQLANGVSVTGGLSGDGADFVETLVGLNEMPKSKYILAIGFYGEGLNVSYSSVGGWERFGIKRTVTKSINNVLHEIDGEPALELYKTYLGDQADDLPASALLFPLEIKSTNSESLVRTILSVDHETNTMTFAGDVPEGSDVYLMRSDNESLTNGAKRAGEKAQEMLNGPAQLGILVSCVGRKLVMKHWVDDEVEAIRDAIGDGAAIAGFYSYGELAPTEKGGSCLLHNQTMTLTLLNEG